MGVERAVIPVDDLGAAIERFEAEGYRLVTISPADDPRVADLDGPERNVRLDVTATEAAVITVEPQPLTIPELAPELVISRAADAEHGTGRAGMQYRDLIPSRLGGRFIASHIAIHDGGPVPDYVHHHAIRFQLIFCNAGWVKVVYEDQGEPFVMHPGDCVIQPPHIRHRVLESSDELEVVEIGCPAEHDTHRDHELELPNATGDPTRRWGDQRFVRHVDGDHDWEPWRQAGWIAQPFGIAAATDGLAEGRLVKPQGDAGAELVAHDGEFEFLFVRSGDVVFVDASGETTLGPGDSIVVPAGHAHRLVAESAELLEVALPG
ncbi:MAG: cupin domain-containing protein [Actinomycetota bacterium]